MALAFIADLTPHASIFLIICILAVCLFEAINGFHDAAHAVATVIYTNALKPVTAVVWSGICNFIGFWIGGISVAIGVIKLMPLNDLLVQSLNENIALVLAILFSAISWNLLTWYYGIPCSSSHTLIGALLGGALAFWSAHGGEGVNWSKAMDIGISLFLSPFIGFTLAALLVFFMNNVFKWKKLFKEHKKGQPPPFGTRTLLITTCSLVSFSHGSNDGQKGLGLMLVVLIAFMPLQFTLNPNFPPAEIKVHVQKIEQALAKTTINGEFQEEVAAFTSLGNKLEAKLDTINISNKKSLFETRKLIQQYSNTISAAIKGGVIRGEMAKSIKPELKALNASFEFAPFWSMLLTALSIGVGTMFGWKRIVVTLGEKIGKTHITYGQGASAEMVGAATIGLSSFFGLPVSTTQTVSSAVAGSMVAVGGVKNLRKPTILSIGLAWVLTLPVTIVLSMVLYYVFRIFI